MGRQGWNINQARQVDGVLSIEFDDYKSEFTIKAEVKGVLYKGKCWRGIKFGSLGLNHQIKFRQYIYHLAVFAG